MWRVATLALVLVGLALPAGAAARSVAAPGMSEADQYFETVPGSSGPRSADTSKKEGDALREGSLTPAAARGLRRHGELGRTVAGAVAATAPPARAAGAAVARGGGGAGTGAPRTSRPAPPPSSPASGSPGLGALFPLALAAAAAAAAVFAISRRRRPAAR